MASSELGTIHRDAEADFPSEALDWSNGVFTCACVCGGTIDVSLGNYRRKTTIHYCLTFLNWSHPAESQVSIASDNFAVSRAKLGPFCIHRQNVSTSYN